MLISNVRGACLTCHCERLRSNRRVGRFTGVNLGREGARGAPYVYAKLAFLQIFLIYFRTASSKRE